MIQIACYLYSYMSDGGIDAKRLTAQIERVRAESLSSPAKPLAVRRDGVSEGKAVSGGGADSENHHRGNQSPLDFSKHQNEVKKRISEIDDVIRLKRVSTNNNLSYCYIVWIEKCLL